MNFIQDQVTYAREVSGGEKKKHIHTGAMDRLFIIVNEKK